MNHLAIIKKNWLEKILSGEKTIESRWYKNKKIPFNLIKKEDIIYFKETGKQVSVTSSVENVLFFENLDSNKIKEIIDNYGKYICIDNEYIANLIGKKYCTLIFLKDIKKIEPFSVYKRGYGNMCAWISIDNINKIKASGKN